MHGGEQTPDTYNPITWEDGHELEAAREYLKKKKKAKFESLTIYEKKVTKNKHLETNTAFDRHLLSTYVPSPMQDTRNTKLMQSGPCPTEFTV